MVSFLQFSYLHIFSLDALSFPLRYFIHPKKATVSRFTDILFKEYFFASTNKGSTIGL
jgi:hypothetical protein